MVQDFELFGGTALTPSGRALKNSKAKAILSRCAIFNPATAVFRVLDIFAKLRRSPRIINRCRSY
jgi:hypothetical protein